MSLFASFLMQQTNIQVHIKKSEEARTKHFLYLKLEDLFFLLVIFHVNIFIDLNNLWVLKYQ